MQIVRTEVAKAIADNGEPIVRVAFCGQGGERVTVDMVGPGGEAINHEEVVGQAKGLLVQTATFDLAANDYAAESGGNFDEITLTSAETGGAGVYIFEYRDGEASRSVPPSQMPSFEAAREEAIRSAIDLLDELRTGTADLSGWLVRLRGENGELLCAIDVQEAEAARQAAR